MRRWKTILVISLVAAGSFATGAYANKVLVGIVQSIGGNHVIVPAPELQIVESLWSIDPQKSLVTDVDLLVTTNSPVWQLKLYQIDVQVSCEQPGGIEYICSNGLVNIVLPSHGTGLRPVRVLLSTPIDPEITEIHDLSFIVTDLERVPPQPPTIVVGANPAEVSVQQGSSVGVSVMVVGVTGEPAGKQVSVMLNPQPLPPGVTVSPASQMVTLQSYPNMPGAVMADSFFDVFVDVTAPVGTIDTEMVALDLSGGRLDSSILRIHILPPGNPNPPPRELPNLLFQNCQLPPVINQGGTASASPCFTIAPYPTGAVGTLVNLVVLNNGVAPSGATTIAASGDATCADPAAICTVPALPPGVTAPVTVVCFSHPCNFNVAVDPANIVVESNEADNVILGTIP